MSSLYYVIPTQALSIPLKFIICLPSRLSLVYTRHVVYVRINICMMKYSYIFTPRSIYIHFDHARFRTPRRPRRLDSISETWKLALSFSRDLLTQISSECWALILVRSPVCHQPFIKLILAPLSSRCKQEP